METTANGCPNPDTAIPYPTAFLQPGINIDIVHNAEVFVQGGSVGSQGYEGAFSSSFEIGGGNWGTGSFDFTNDNDYSGSFDYQFSFLDKDHTLISDVNKNSELFDGIGTKGLVIIPSHTSNHVKNNLEFYLQKAGLIQSTTTTKSTSNY